jgi:hypothetical protein
VDVKLVVKLREEDGLRVFENRALRKIFALQRGFEDFRLSDGRKNQDNSASKFTEFNFVFKHPVACHTKTSMYNTVRQ